MHLHAEQLTLLLAAAEKSQAAGDLENATRYYQAMSEHEPYSETAWEGLARSWEERGDHAQAAEARERFQQLLEDEE